MNPVRPPCQDLADLADNVGVVKITSQHKMVSIAGCLQITGVLGAEGGDSLRQAVFGGSNPVRAEIGQSCQDYFGEGGVSAPKIPILTGQNVLRTLKQNPVRISEVAR